MGLWAPRSTNPAKGDRGLSESDMEQFYFEMHRTHDIAAVVPCLYGLGRPTISGASRSPAGGGNGGRVEMAECLISMKGLEFISNRPAGNSQTPRKQGSSCTF